MRSSRHQFEYSGQLLHVDDCIAHLMMPARALNLLSDLVPLSAGFGLNIYPRKKGMHAELARREDSAPFGGPGADSFSHRCH
jgi:hypothetical protein